MRYFVTQHTDQGIDVPLTLATCIYSSQFNLIAFFTHHFLFNKPPTAEITKHYLLSTTSTKVQVKWRTRKLPSDSFPWITLCITITPSAQWTKLRRRREHTSTWQVKNFAGLLKGWGECTLTWWIILLKQL